MRALARWVWLVAANDLRLEARSRGRLVSMAAFAVLAGLLFGFALDRSAVAGRDVAAALLWLIVLFASMGGAGRTFDPDEEDGAFRHLLLTPIPRHALFLGKMAAHLALVWIVAALSFVSVTAFLGVRGVGSPLAHMAALLPGTIGIAAVGTLLGRISRHSTLGDTLLPVLALPLLVPAVLFGATASARVFLERPWPEISGAVRVLWAFALVAVVAGAALFRHLTDE